MATPPIIPAGGISSGGGVELALGLDEASAPAPQGMLCDDIDPETGEFLSLMSSVHPVDGAIAFNFRVARGSGAAVANVGHRYQEIRKKDGRVEGELTNEARRILEPFLDRALIRLERFTTDVDDDNHGADGAAQIVRYRNRITAKPEEVLIP